MGKSVGTGRRMYLEEVAKNACRKNPDERDGPHGSSYQKGQYGKNYDDKGNSSWQKRVLESVLFETDGRVDTNVEVKCFRRSGHSESTQAERRREDKAGSP